MDPKLALRVKESIVGTVLRTHRVCLVVGWEGAGKTTAVLGAAAVYGPVYYLSLTGTSTPAPTLPDGLSLTQVPTLAALPSAPSGDAVLVLDDADRAVNALSSAVPVIAQWPGKVVVICRTQPACEGLQTSIDAVVRIRDESAEIIYSRLRELR